jgi:putative Mg2+ transporter-C (MgtC) family protein
MPLQLDWRVIALRLFLTLLAAGLLGLNRDEHGRPAGLRTNILVGLAACLAMIQANLLNHSIGKTSDSFVVMDTMRLPLGILSGIGFIGAGAILKRGEMVVGVTTAATLWFVTVLGLCFGGGQLALGIAGAAIGFLVLAGLKHIELRLPELHRASLLLDLSEGATLTPDTIEPRLLSQGVHLKQTLINYAADAPQSKKLGWSVEWRSKKGDHKIPAVIAELAQDAQVLQLNFVTND